jgi:hypothetical protein
MSVWFNISQYVIYPLKLFYFQGPQFMGYGGWEGISFEDICSRLTSIPAKHWAEHLLQCNDLIERQFHSYIVALFVGFYVVFVYKLVSFIWFHYFIVKPLLKEIKILMEKN